MNTLPWHRLSGQRRCSFGPLLLLTSAVVLSACGGGATASGPSSQSGALRVPVDAVYVNGTVITIDKNGTTAEGFAVLGDKFVAIGTSDEVEALAGPGTRVVDLKGRIVVPGFFAAHDHFPGAGMVATRSINLNSPPMGEIQTIDDIIEALKERAANSPAGQWIEGRGYDDTLLKDARHPTRYDLDKASTEHPIWISHTSGHLGVANSKALQMAGVTKDTPQPEGGVIRKDPRTGEPNGVFEESGGLVRRLIPPLTRAEQMEAFRAAVEIYVKQGVTTTVIAGGNRESFRALQKAQEEGLLSLRIIAMSSKSSQGEPASAQLGGFVSGFGGLHLKLGAVKIVQDGSNQGYTGYFTEPYHTSFNGDPNWRGYPRRSQEELTAMVKELHRDGYQIAIHGNGDAAIDQILTAFRAAQEDYPRADARHRIEHCQLVRKDQLDEIYELGITPSFFVGHVYYWGDRHREIFMGPERAAGISPLNSAKQRDIRFTVHDDTPVTSVDPLQLVWVASNRTTRSGEVLGPEERVDPEVALRSITIDAAWQNFEEEIKGSIEPGKLADFVVLSDNPLMIDPARIRDIEILETFVGGKRVYEAKAGL